MAMFRTELKRGPLMRVSYAFNLRKGREQKKDDGSTKTEYGATFILPKADTAGMAILQGMVKEAIVGEWGEKGIDKFKNGLIRNPLLDGAGKEARNKTTGEINPGLGEGVIFIRAKSNDPVKVFNKAVQPASDEEIISGHWGYPVLNVYAWHNPKNGDGVSFGITMFQFVRDDEVLGSGGSGNPDDFFERVDTGDGDAPAVGSGGAGDMFS